MKATKIKWQTNKPEDLLLLPDEVDLPAELFLKTSLTTDAVAKAFLETKFHFQAESFEIEEGHLSNDLDLLNRILEERRGNYGQYTTALELLDMGVKPYDMITRYGFDETVVKDAVEAEMASYPEELE